MSSTENISVHVRVRPLNDLETDKGHAWRVEGNSIFQTEPGTDARVSDNTYKLDTVFDGNQATAEVYSRTTQPLIQQVVEGFNSTVFAYGQTSSGKTHTIRGTAGEPGIIPLAVAELFTLIERMQAREFLIRVSYMELYNEDVNDLLEHKNTKLQVCEHKENGVFVAGLREDIVSSPEQVMALLEAGERHRHFGATKMNKQSSRSHTVFRMVVESRSREAHSDGSGYCGAIRMSTLTLVDLAGSERIAKTGAEGVRRKEGASINKSLLTLGNVINKLSEGVAEQGGHIPYRDSKLTRILQPSLGGNAKTAIICTVTPAADHVEETHNTLRFACRAKRVVNTAVVNEVLSEASVLKRQAKEIEELRRMLAATDNPHMEEEIGRLRAALLRQEQENERMQAQLAAAEEAKERAQHKADNMARKLLDTSSRPGSSSQGEGKPKQEKRRESCPGPGARAFAPKPLAVQDENQNSYQLLGKAAEPKLAQGELHCAHLEETQFELQAKEAKRGILGSELAESGQAAAELQDGQDEQAAQLAELQDKRDKLAAQLAAAEAELQSATHEVEDLRSEVEAEQLGRRQPDLQGRLLELVAAHALLVHQKGELEKALAAAESQLAQERGARAAAESELERVRAERDASRREMEGRLQEAEGSVEKWKLVAEVAQAKEEELQAELAVMRQELEATRSELAAAQEASLELGQRTEQAEVEAVPQEQLQALPQQQSTLQAQSREQPEELPKMYGYFRRIDDPSKRKPPNGSFGVSIRPAYGKHADEAVVGAYDLKAWEDGCDLFLRGKVNPLRHANPPRKHVWVLLDYKEALRVGRKPFEERLGEVLQFKYAFGKPHNKVCKGWEFVIGEP